LAITDCINNTLTFSISNIYPKKKKGKKKRSGEKWVMQQMKKEGCRSSAPKKKEG